MSSTRLTKAPNLRDGLYCSVLAYSNTSHTLAVGLGSLLYAWSEMQGVHLLNLAYGRSDGTLNLMSLYDRALPRFEV